MPVFEYDHQQGIAALTAERSHEVLPPYRHPFKEWMLKCDQHGPWLNLRSLTPSPPLNLACSARRKRRPTLLKKLYTAGNYLGRDTREGHTFMNETENTRETGCGRRRLR